jgi:transcriptional regulator with XRE-family HTH domain
MEKRLNTSSIQDKLTELGLTRTGLAEKVGKTRAAVSKWMKGDAFPRPPELLKIGQALGMRYGELVVEIAVKPLPLVAFRKRANTKTTDAHVARAREMGRFLQALVKHLDFDPFMAPARLKQPSCEYAYLQQLVIKLRRELGLSDGEPIGIENLICKFAEHQAVIIPTLWGKKDRHENALHIYLPESETTWIYLNLDSEKHDFKFWMAHELGHVLSVDLLAAGRLEAAEDFADAFAGALIFPEAAAKKVFLEYGAARRARDRVSILCRIAERFEISPLTVYKELENYTKACSRDFIPVESKVLHASAAAFNKGHSTMSEALFDGEHPSADHFMHKSAERFETSFYKALGACTRERKLSSGTLARILDVPLTDARAFHDALI